MFLQLVAGGHLLLFVTRTERWFFEPPYPAAILIAAIVATQVLAVLMCAFGLLMPAIPWSLIGWVWALQHHLDVRARRRPPVDRTPARPSHGAAGEVGGDRDAQLAART